MNLTENRQPSLQAINLTKKFADRTSLSGATSIPFGVYDPAGISDLQTALEGAHQSGNNFVR